MHLQTQRLFLRDFTIDDFADVHAYASLPQTVRFMEWGPNTEDQTKDFLHRKVAAQQANPRVEYEFAIVLGETGHVIGGVGLRLNRPQHRAADMGYVLHPNQWNHGYATEAARAILDFGFKAHNLHRIMANYMPRNQRSGNLLKRLGFTVEGHARDYIMINGAWEDHILFAMLREDGGAV